MKRLNREVLQPDVTVSLSVTVLLVVTLRGIVESVLHIAYSVLVSVSVVA